MGLDVLQYCIGAVVVTEMVAKDAGNSADITENSCEGKRRSWETKVRNLELEILSNSQKFHWHNHLNVHNGLFRRSEEGLGVLVNLADLSRDIKQTCFHGDMPPPEDRVKGE